MLVLATIRYFFLEFLWEFYLGIILEILLVNLLGILSDLNFVHDKQRHKFWIWEEIRLDGRVKKKSLEALAGAFFCLKNQCWFSSPQSDSDMKKVFCGMVKLKQQEKVNGEVWMLKTWTISNSELPRERSTKMIPKNWPIDINQWTNFKAPQSPTANKS